MKDNTCPCGRKFKSDFHELCPDCEDFSRFKHSDFLQRQRDMDITGQEEEVFRGEV